MTLEQRLDALTSMPKEELRATWQAGLATSPPRVSADLLRRLLGHALQEKAMGGLSSAQRQTLRRLGAGRSDKSMKAGTRLIRQWNNRTIAVTVDEGGFMWEDRSYRSLSAIAREVTGTAWSGPRFFGLRDNG